MSAFTTDAPLQSDNRLTRAEFLLRGASAIGLAEILPKIEAAPEIAPGAVYDLRDFVRWVHDELEPSVRLPGPAGSYASTPGGTKAEIYGTADMACILYTIGALRPTEKERAEWASVFASLRDPATGFFIDTDPTLPPLHNTAATLSAMELFDFVPTPPRIPPDMASPKAYLSTLDFNEKVYPDAHRGAALGALFALTPALADPAWFREYFAFLDNVYEPTTGMIGRKDPHRRDPGMIGGTFAYSFIYYAFNRRPPYSERRVDTILAMQQPDGFWAPRNHLWLTLDALSLITRAIRYAPYRVAEVHASVRKAMDVFMAKVYSPEGRRRSFTGNQAVHGVTAAVSIAAEMQQFLGADVVITETPLRFMLDRRPFI